MTTKLPIFVGGTARSGTTLLTELIGNHSMISPIYETHFLPRLIELNKITDQNKFTYNKLEIRRFLHKWARSLPKLKNGNDTRKNNHHHVNLNEEFVSPHVEELLDNFHFGINNSDIIHHFTSVLFENHTNKENKLFWVNKTPANIDYIFELYELFPNMKFIQIVRNRDDVVNSNLKQNWNTFDKEEIEHIWLRDVKIGSTFFNLYPRNCAIIHYELIIKYPVYWLSYIFDWLLPHSSKELNKKEVERIVKLFNIGEK